MCCLLVAVVVVVDIDIIKKLMPGSQGSLFLNGDDVSKRREVRLKLKQGKRPL